MNSFFQNISLFTKLYLGFVPCIVSYANRGDYTQPVGSISILLPDATPSAPHYTIASYGLKGNVVFRGQVRV